jgi:iron complex outermembrane receptor protein
MRPKATTSGFDSRRTSTSAANDLLRLGRSISALHARRLVAASGTGGMWPGNAFRTSTTASATVWRLRRMGKRYPPQWTTLLGARYERGRTDAGMVRGYNLATAPTGSRRHHGNPTVDAAAFNNADRSQSRQQLRPDRAGPLHRGNTTDVEFGLARKVRSPNLYERYTWSTAGHDGGLMNNFVGDGNGYVGNLDLEAGEGLHRLRHLRLHTPRIVAGNSRRRRTTPTSTTTSTPSAVTHRRLGGCPTQRPTNHLRPCLQYANQSARLYGLDLSGRMPLAKTGFRRIRPERPAELHQGREPRHRRRPLQHHAAQRQGGADAPDRRLEQRHRSGRRRRQEGQPPTCATKSRPPATA